MKPIKIKNLTWDPSIYPRTTKSQQTINAYAEALEIGAQFPHYTKKKKEYEQKTNKDIPSISSYTKKDYKQFFKDFFTLAHKNTKPTTTLAFLNADWRDFESTPAAEEKPDKAITIFDYHGLLSETGWKTIHLSACGTHRQVA